MVDKIELQKIGSDLISALGYDPNSPGLKDTPRRFAHAWAEFIDYSPGNTLTTFSSVTVDQMVVVKGMRVYSMCEHHLLPFWCDISIGYLTARKVLGLSKFARIAHRHAHKLQLQERLVSDIANEITQTAGTGDVAVIASGVHLCMVMRGVQTDGTMISSSMHGAFRESQAARQEFLSLAGFGG